MLWAAQGFFRSRCSSPSEELTSTTLTGVTVLVPENQGATCCLPSEAVCKNQRDETKRMQARASTPKPTA